MPVPCDHVVESIADRCGYHAPNHRQTPDPSEVSRNPQGRRGTRDHLGPGAVRFDPYDGIDALQIRMLAENPATPRAFQRSEQQRHISIVP